MSCSVTFNKQHIFNTVHFKPRPLNASCLFRVAFPLQSTSDFNRIALHLFFNLKNKTCF